ncbi:hypothetical protein EDEG_02280 [Edhazardia aedis USNM 41457]|uniref:Uncharacterized protein n=1 Tax=Edhazardia aedis (strain USNM 41457) TaxID=1003232 RepID=J9DL99_EDHAE|nr:hypothetical protein EDEG_02280 [Edhazardia aedis USNM 41457]|eukprot:EJW03370.1 hypothetical protein EDEG_02280 [Edhazardia aedis USNM 41457]
MDKKNKKCNNGICAQNSVESRKNPKMCHKQQLSHVFCYVNILLIIFSFLSLLRTAETENLNFREENTNPLTIQAVVDDQKLAGIEEKLNLEEVHSRFNEVVKMLSDGNNLDPNIRKEAIESIKSISNDIYIKIESLIEVFLKKKLNLTGEKSQSKIYEDSQYNLVKNDNETFDTSILYLEKPTGTHQNDDSIIEKTIDDIFNGINNGKIENIYKEYIIQKDEEFEIVCKTQPTTQTEDHKNILNSKDSSTVENDTNKPDSDYKTAIKAIQEYINIHLKTIEGWFIKEKYDYIINLTLIVQKEIISSLIMSIYICEIDEKICDFKNFKSLKYILLKEMISDFLTRAIRKSGDSVLFEDENYVMRELLDKEFLLKIFGKIPDIENKIEDEHVRKRLYSFTRVTLEHIKSTIPLNFKEFNKRFFMNYFKTKSISRIQNAFDELTKLKECHIMFLYNLIKLNKQHEQDQINNKK